MIPLLLEARRTLKLFQKCVISDFCRKVHEKCALLGYYAASSGKFFTDVSGQLIGPIFRVRHFIHMCRVCQVSCTIYQLILTCLSGTTLLSSTCRALRCVLSFTY